MWDTAAARCTSTLHGHTDAILDFDLSADGRFALSCGMDGTVRLWGVSTSACFRVYRSHAPGAWVKTVRFTPDGAGFVSAGLDNRLVHWSLASDARQPIRSWMAHDDHVRTSAQCAAVIMRGCGCSVQHMKQAVDSSAQQWRGLY